jgi:transcription elongation factor Elf1
MMRKLTTAIDKKGNRINIDNYNKQSDSKQFFCPYCKKEVIPKQGNNKIWHFSHKGKNCNLNELKQADNKTKDFSLNNYMNKTVSSTNYKFSHPKKFLCPLCNEVHLFDNGKLWSKEEYICKKCFLSLTPEQTRNLMRRNLN